MKLFLVTLTTTIAILSGSSMIAAADNESDVLNTLVKASSPDVVCRKGDARKGIFSIRSFEGRLCKVGYIAAFAELICAGVSDYPSSGCAKEAKKALNGQNPQQVLQGAVDKHVGHAKDFVCAGARKSNKSALKAVASAAKC